VEDALAIARLEAEDEEGELWAVWSVAGWRADSRDSGIPRMGCTYERDEKDGHHSPEPIGAIGGEVLVSGPRIHVQCVVGTRRKEVHVDVLVLYLEMCGCSLLSGNLGRTAMKKRSVFINVRKIQHPQYL
jgi:hypothetical protein